MSSGKSSTTSVTQQPPQLIPEGKQGYQMGQNYYQSILANPPIYGGPRMADITPAQQAYMDQSRQYFGGRQPYQDVGEQQLFSTLAGDYMYDPNQNARFRDVGTNFSDLRNFDPGQLGDVSRLRNNIDLGTIKVGGENAAQVQARNADYNPNERFMWTKPSDAEIQKFVESAQMPMVRELEQNTLPQIQSDFGTTGGGVNNIREQYAKVGAVQNFTTQLGKEVIAPIFNQMQTLDENFKNAERERLAGLAAGDADRAERASAETAQLQTQRNLLEAQLNTTLRTTGAQLSSQERQAAAQLLTQGNIARAQDILQGKTAGAQLGVQAEAQNQQADLTRAQQRLDAWNQERGRMVGSISQVPTLLQSEGLREMMLRSSGEYERAFNQEAINAQKEAWAEPIQEQSTAANALFGAAGMGPGSAESMTKQGGGGLDQAMSAIGTIASIAALVAKCWVAEAIYGRFAAETLYARFYINFVWKGRLADFTRFLYGRFGEKLAFKVRKYRFLRMLLKPLFDVAVRKGAAALKGNATHA